MTSSSARFTCEHVAGRSVPLRRLRRCSVHRIVRSQTLRGENVSPAQKPLEAEAREDAMATRDDKETSTSSRPDPDEEQSPRTPGLAEIIVSFVRMVVSGLGRALSMLFLWPSRLGQQAFNQGSLLRSAVRLAMFLTSLFLWQMFWGGSRGVESKVVPYSSFVQLARAGLIHSAQVDEPSSTLHFSVNTAAPQAAKRHGMRWFSRPKPEPAQPPPQLVRCSTRLVDKDTSFINYLVDNNVTFGVKKQTVADSFARACGMLFALWIPLLPMFFVIKRMMDAQMGKNEKSKPTYTPPDTTFADVAGVDTVKVELDEAIQCLRNPEKFEKLNARMPSGILLSGPPGTGKTLLARAVAGQAGVPFFAVSASEFVEMFVGRGAARIRELFAQARKAAPSVIFIDELDAVGSKRGMGVNDERDQTLNQLLTELDGFEARTGVLVLAATNRPQVLDPALLRPGRISRRIVVPLPDEAGRQDILSVHLRKIPMESDGLKAEAVEYLAKLTPGFSGAELFNVVNEGALLAARRDGALVTVTDLVEGVSRTRFGVNAPRSPFGQLFKRLGDAIAGGNPAQPHASALL